MKRIMRRKVCRRRKRKGGWSQKEWRREIRRREIKRWRGEMEKKEKGI